MTTAVRVTRWYDRRSRNWIVQKLDAADCQVGDAGIAGTKDGAIAYEKQFNKEIADAAEDDGVDWYALSNGLGTVFPCGTVVNPDEDI